MTASKTFLVSLFQHGIIIFILLGSAASYLPNLIIVLPLVSIFAYMTYSNYRQLQLLLHNNVFDEVDHMIHSNEYQLSNLNMEKMVNTMNRCAEATGKLIQYRLDVRNTSIYHIFIGVLVMIYPFLIRGELF